MAYRFLIDTAIETIKKRYDDSHVPSIDDTVCVICAGNGNIYIGLNNYTMQGNIPNNIHAEIEALNKMRSDGETLVKAITVFNSCNFAPVLPCNGCINLIISINSENIDSLVITPNGDMKITDVGRYAANSARMFQRDYSVYHTIPEHSRGSSLYTLQDPAYINMNSQPLDAGHREQSHGKPLYMPKSDADNSVIKSENISTGASSVLKNKLNSILGDK